MSSIARFDTWQAADGTNVARYNAGVLEVWDGSAWGAPVSGIAFASISATTGSPSTGSFTDANSLSWNYYDFTGNGSITLDSDGLIDILLVGAGGGSENVSNKGGGGAGALRWGMQYVPAGTYAITIGAGTSGDGGTTSFGTLFYAGGGAQGQALNSDGTGVYHFGVEHGGCSAGYRIENFTGGAATGGGQGSRGGASGVTTAPSGIILNYNGSSIEFGKGGGSDTPLANAGWGGDYDVNGSSGSDGRVIVKVLA